MRVNWPERVWVNSPVRRVVQTREVRFFRRFLNLPAGADCLEIGCGRGAAVPLIFGAFGPRRVDALDIDPEMIGLAMRKGERKDPGRGLFLVADAQDLPYHDESLDAVFNFGIIHHLEDWSRGIEEIARVLRSGGVFCFEEIYPPLYANFISRRLLLHPTENRFHGPEFGAALAEAGLEILPGYRENRFGILGVAVKGGGRPRR